MGYFSGKKVWVTGASSGIGKALSITLSEQGAELILSSRKQAALEEVKALCSQSPQVDVLPLDLADHEGLHDLVNANWPLLEKVDVLINNGGISQRSLAKDTKFEVYKRLIEINYLGTVCLSGLILPFFIKKNAGHYVVISSMAGKFGVPLRSGYSGAKMALHGYFDALRAELHETNINVTMVCPGFINTDISKNALQGDGTAYKKMDEAQEKGMDVRKFAKEMLKAIENHKAEVYFGGFRETKLALWVSRMFPSLFRSIISKSKVN